MLKSLSTTKSKQKKLMLTEPKEFHFHLDNRLVPHEKIMSSQELLEIEMQNMPKFKAKPLNKAIFHKVVGLPKVTKKSTTKHNEFKLSYKSLNRGNTSMNTSFISSNCSYFKAKPMPDFSKIFAPSITHQCSKSQGILFTRI